MAVESGESCVLLESTDEASDLSDTSPSDSIQQVTESSSGTQSRSSSVPLLDRLRSPGPSELSRKRKIRRNIPPVGKQRGKGGRSSAGPKSQRVCEFKGDMLVVSGGRLFCNACREELSMKWSAIVSHIKSEKHANGKAKLTEKSVHEKDIAKVLIKYNEEVHLEGETLPVEQQVYRVKVVCAFLRAGVPLHKVTSFRGILEENALRCVEHIHDLIYHHHSTFCNL